MAEQKGKQIVDIISEHVKSRMPYFPAYKEILEDILLPKEQAKLEEWESSVGPSPEFAPLDESIFEMARIQTLVAGIPRLDSAIYEILKGLQQEVYDLNRKVEELAKAVEGKAKIYNATIYELSNDMYELTWPLQIVLEEDDEETVARIPQLSLYASADTDSEAINELKQEVIRLYEELETSDVKLGPLPDSWLRTLRKLIVKKK